MIYACKDVDGLSDDAEIIDYKMVSYTPEAVQLGEINISNDTIYIPLIQGKYSFPLTVNLEFKFSPSIDKVIGEHNKFVFEYNQTTGEFKANNDFGNTTSFSVVAASGAFKRWYVTLQEAPNSEDAGITGFRIKNYKLENSLFAPLGVIDNIDTLVSLFYINSDFPRKIAPEIFLSGGARIVDVPDTVEFVTANQKREFAVISASGNTKDWKVGLKKAEFAEDISTLPSAERKRLTLEKSDVKITTSTSSGMQLEKMDIDETGGIISADIHNLSYPVQLKLEYGDLHQKQIVGINSGEAISFASSTEKVDFYIFDEIGQKVRKWQLQVREALNGSTEIYNLEIEKIESNTGLIRVDPNIRIELQSRTIWIDLPTIAGVTSLTMDVKWELPVNAKIEEPSKTIYFANLTEEKTFTVKNGTLSEQWTVRLNYPESNTEAEIVRFGINRFSAGVVMVDEKFRIDAINGVVRMLIQDAAYPFTLIPEIELSAGAELQGISSFQPIEFHHPEDVISFTVRSESGLLKQWRIELLSTPQLQDPTFVHWKEADWYSTQPDLSGNRKKDSIPIYWSTANNSVVQGTSKANLGMNREGVKLTTSKNTSFVKAIAAGSAFLGKFNFNLSDVGEPKKMTNFGIPFTARPVAIEVEVEYKAGQVLERLNKETNSFDVIPNDKDRGSIWVELLHWNGEGTYEYHGDPVTSVTMLGRGEYEFVDTNGMVKVRIPINYYTQSLKPTHITIVMSSGSRGDDFIGAVGSTLKATNVRLIY
jgi:hypothetical protein